MKRKKAQADLSSPQDSALERFMPLIPADDLALLLAELEQPLAPAFRFNPLKATGDTVQSWGQRYGWDLQAVPFCESGWWVQNAQTALSQTIEHRLGAYYIQEAASMLPPELFDWEGLDQPLVLDMAASPGGKTTHLIAKTGDRGLVLANDASADRITALRLVLQNWGGLHCAVSNFHGEKFGDWFPDTFDRVLLDAPCSMQGLRSTEAHPMRAITDRERSSLAARQLRLLESALRAVRPGGQVVYSTCTLEPEEDEGVVDGLLRGHPGQVRVDDLSRQMPVPAPGLSMAGELSFSPVIRQTARLWPHIYHTAGFFAARLTKLSSEHLAPVEFRGRPLSQVGWMPVGRKDRKNLCAVYLDAYGVDLEETLESLALDLWQRKGTVYAFPQSFLLRFGSLPVQGLGLMMGEAGPDGIALTHEWVARFGATFQAGRYTIDAEQLPAWLRGEDLPVSSNAGVSLGQVVAVFDGEGRLVGHGKLGSNRLRNLIPRRLL